MKMVRVLLAAAAVMVVFASVGHGALRFAPATDKGWELKEKDGKAKTYIDDEGDVKSYCLKSDKASFSIQRKVEVDVSRYRYVTWRWKVKELPERGDFRDGDTDDQAAQFFVAFDGDDSICYIWDSNAPVGSTGEQSMPWILSIKILVVESGPEKLGRWVSVTRNVYEDFKALYGEEPPMAEGIRFQINSQYTGDTAEACLDCVEFTTAPPLASAESRAE